MFKVPNGQNPYSTIGRYIRDNTTAIEDMIAVIEIDGITMNELLLVDMHEDEYFVWKSDWWDGEKDIALIDFFPVSDAQKPSAFATDTNVGDMISRQAAIDAINCVMIMKGIRSGKSIVAEAVESAKRIMTDNIRDLPSAQPERIKGRWEVASTGYSGFMRCSACKTRCCGDYRSMNFCPNCGAEMREVTT